MDTFAESMSRLERGDNGDGCASPRLAQHHDIMNLILMSVALVFERGTFAHYARLYSRVSLNAILATFDRLSGLFSI